MSKADNAAQPTVLQKGPPRAGAWWRLPVLLAVVLAAIVVARSIGTRDGESSSAKNPLPTLADPLGRTVSLEIRFGDGQERKFDSVPWHEAITVDDLLTAVSRLPNGISYTLHGDGAMTLLVSIDNTRNDRPPGQNFWTYSVNEKRADRSLAVYELEPGDRVLWTFGPPE